MIPSDIGAMISLLHKFDHPIDPMNSSSPRNQTNGINQTDQTNEMDQIPLAYLGILCKNKGSTA